ncbi:hypothetical protein GA0115255_111861, partial [Streptomyces sp. Ncost-T6T-2b]
MQGRRLVSAVSNSRVFRTAGSVSHVEPSTGVSAVRDWGSLASGSGSEEGVASGAPDGASDGVPGASEEAPGSAVGLSVAVRGVSGRLPDVVSPSSPPEASRAPRKPPVTISTTAAAAPSGTRYFGRCRRPGA